jgi:uncharacterized protein (TIGR02001 family)
MIAFASLVPGGVYAGDHEAFSANVSLTTEYSYRGISQTDKRPAIQGGFDYKHAGGAYAGAWASSISWLRDAERGTNVSSGNSAEIDVYAGYAGKARHFDFDVGLLQYYYPGNFNSRWRQAAGLKNPGTLEAYAGVSWKFVSLKYSRALSNLFGSPESRGSDYIDLSISYKARDDLSLDAHYGHQHVKGPGESYADWKLGATYSMGGFDIGLHYVNTTIRHASSVNADGRGILSIKKSF